MNKVILMGRLARDPEIRYTQTGKAVASFTVAAAKPYNKEAEKQGADFINCVAWEKQAEIIGNRFIKGSPILIDGRLQSRSYDAQDCSKRYVTEVLVKDFEFVGNKPQTGAQEPTGANAFGSEVFPDDQPPF